MVSRVGPTERELDALQCAAHGDTVLEIADRLGITAGAAKQRLRWARARLGAGNTSHAVALAWRQGLIT
jgi:DNA-binding CsgD family transcriptional regulator